MPEVLVASDSEHVRTVVREAIGEPGLAFREFTRGAQVLPSVQEKAPDLAIIDLQIGKMGGMATCLELRLEEGAGRLPHVPVLMLLDRRADVFLARRSQAEGYVIKPVDPMRLNRAVHELLAGGTYHDDAYRPVTVPAPAGPASPAPPGPSGPAT